MSSESGNDQVGSVAGSHDKSVIGFGHDANCLYYPYLWIVIIALGLGLRLLGLNKGIWLDEYSSLKLFSSENFFRMMRLDVHPPLFYLFHKMWAHISMSEPFMRLLSVFFGMGTLILLMQWIKRYSRTGSLLAGLICATLPVMLRYSQEIRGYPILLLTVVCSFIFASKVVTNPKRTTSYIGLTCSLAAAIATHLAGTFLIPCVLAFILLTMGKDYRKIQPGKMVLALVIPGVFFFCIYFFYFQSLPEKHDWWMSPVSIGLIKNTFRKMLGVSLLMWQKQVIKNHIPALATPYNYLMKIIIIWISISMMLGDWRRSGPLFITGVLYMVLLLLYSLLVVPIFWYRTVLPGLVPLIGFAGVQIVTIRIQKIRQLSIWAIIIVTLIFVIGWAGTNAWVPYEQWKQLSRVLKSQWIPGDLVIFCYENTEGPVRYYFPDLSSEAGIAVKKDSKIKELDRDLFKVKNSLEAPVAPCRIFLIVRSDLPMKLKPQIYNTVLKLIEFECGQATFTQKFGILSLSRYEIKHM